jgi:hypothetical protein
MMNRSRVFALVASAALALCTASPAPAGSGAPKIGADDWSMNATIIEACSCPMFCPCYFGSSPAAHVGEHAGHGGAVAEHFCRANNVFRVNKGHFGATKLDGARFWLGLDLGDDFSDGEMEWAVLHFDPSVPPEQREGIKTILTFLYPVKWKSFKLGADELIEWNATKDRAVAKLDAGRGGEVVLNRVQGNTSDPVVISNLKYWGAKRNTGFILMPNEVEAYRLGDKAFEFKGTNGFMITVDLSSKD